MKPGKAARIVKAVSDIATSKDPAKQAGAVAAGALSIAHPIIGAAAAPLVAKGTEALVNKGIKVAKDPEIQAKARELGTRALGATTRAARTLGAAGARKLGEFKGQIGR
jgi:hypothetical protein